MSIEKNFIVNAGIEVGAAANVGTTLNVGSTLTVDGGASINASMTVGNSTVFTSINSVSVTVANTTILPASLSTGNSTVNSSITNTRFAVGNVTTNTTITPTLFTLGNTTTNTSITSTRLSVGNSTVNSVITPSSIDIDGTLYVQGQATFDSTVYIGGSLTVQGTTTFINSNSLDIGDNIITLNADLPPSIGPTENAGIEVNRGSASNVQIRWNESTDKWQATNDGSNYGDIRTTLSDITLGTETTGNYVATIAGGTGVYVTGSGSETAAVTVTIGQDVNATSSVAFAGVTVGNSSLKLNSIELATNRFIANTSGVTITGFANVSTSVNTALFTTGGGFTANNTLVNTAAINVVNQVNAATLFATTSANVGANVQANTTAFRVGDATSNTVITSNFIGGNSTAFLGNSTIYGDLSVTGNTTLGDAATDRVTINANSIIIAANVSIDAGVLFVDSLNNRIGIGTNVPDAPLRVAGAANVTGNAVIGGTANVTGNAVFSGTANVTGLTTLQGGMNTTTANASAALNVGSNVAVNTSAILVGNTLVYTVISSTAIGGNSIAFLGNSIISGTANVSGLASLNGGMNTTTANASVEMNVGANATVNTTAFSIGNTTVNSVITSTMIGGNSIAFLGNSTVTGFMNVTSSVNTALFTTGTGFTANNTLTNVNALNVVNRVNTATLYATTSANIASVVQANTSGLYTSANVTADGQFIGPATGLTGTASQLTANNSTNFNGLGATAYVSNSALFSYNYINATSAAVTFVSNSSLQGYGFVNNSVGTAFNSSNLAGLGATAYVSNSAFLSGSYTFTGVRAHSANVTITGTGTSQLLIGGTAVVANTTGISVGTTVSVNTSAFEVSSAVSTTTLTATTLAITRVDPATANSTVNIIADSSGYGRIELGGDTGGYVDFKSPFADSYDHRIFSNTTGFYILGGSSTSPAANAIYFDAIANVDFNTNTLFVDAVNSKVGVGTNAPDANFTVDNGGTLPDAGNISGKQLGTIHLRSGVGVAADGALAAGISFSGVNTSRRRGLIAAYQDGADGDPHGLKFYTYGSTGSTSNTVTERIAIAANGNVGIGTSTPASLLVVDGTANIVGLATLNGGLNTTTANMSVAVNTSEVNITATTGTGYGRITRAFTTGGLLFETSLGTDTLAYVDFNAPDISTANVVYRFGRSTDTTGTGTLIVYNHTNTNTPRHYIASNGDSYFAVGAGATGIGTITPDAKLQVVGTANISGLTTLSGGMNTTTANVSTALNVGSTLQVNTIALRVGTTVNTVITSTMIGGNSIAYLGNTIISGTLSVSGNATFTGANNTINGIEIGYLNIPQNIENVSYTITADDVGKHVYNSTNATSLTYTIANNTSVPLANGAAITFVNGNTATITIANGAGVTLQLAGSTTTGSRTLAPGGLATVLKVGTNRWFVSGAGVT